MIKIPWYITATSSGILHIILSGPFEKKTMAEINFASQRDYYLVKAGELFGDDPSLSPTVEIVFSDEVFEIGSKVSAEKLRYGRWKETVKKPTFVSASDFLRNVMKAKVDEEK